MFLKRIFLLAITICSSLSASASFQNALDAQIEEDLSEIGSRSFTNKELLKKFYELSGKGQRVLYCKIRNNSSEWIKSEIRNKGRNEDVFQFFDELSKKYTLPDTDFILCIEDGFHGDSDVPIFTFAANWKSKKNVLLFPDFEALFGQDNDKLLQYSQSYPWEKKINKMFFRGASTGGIDPNDPCLGNDRVRLIVFSHYHPELLEADFSSVFSPQIGELMSRLQKPIVPFLPVADHFLYKYLIDADGNSTTYSRCRWILSSNSVLLKVSSDLTQWYYKILIPYENYIPIRQDLSDLEDIYQWLTTHDEHAREIAMNGQVLGFEAFSRESIERYVYQLLKGYSEKILLLEDDKTEKSKIPYFLRRARS